MEATWSSLKVLSGESAAAQNADDLADSLQVSS